MKTCSVEGCSGKIHVKGYCHSHYKRWWRYGDPLLGGIKYGAAREWIEAAINSNTDECLNFPFCRVKRTGVGRARIDGETVTVSAYVCERVHGPKPTDQYYECCHSCGNGHLGCANPKHLRWGTRQENVQDGIAHGTMYQCIKGLGVNAKPNN